jgi:signal transduction histidine kinase/two-component SAPR family response regulator
MPLTDLRANDMDLSNSIHPPERAPATRGGLAEPINILLVDDEPKNLTVLESILNNPGYRLVRAETADQALLALVAQEFALIVLDIRMPGMSGFELAQLIKKRKKTSGVPIIFLTAYYNEDQHVLEGYESGAVDYLHKPVNPTILCSKVAIFAELHRKTRECALANRTLLAEAAERRRTQEKLLALNNELEQRVEARTNELREAAHRKDEFLAMLSHELRNPLAPLRNAVEILHLQNSTDPHVLAARDMIERQVVHLVRLVDDLLDVSRVSRGKIQLRKETFDLAVVVRQAEEISRSIMKARRHELIVTLPREQVPVEGDVTRLTQVIANLLDNAAKYTDDGGKIWLTLEKKSDMALLRVRDNGRGLDAEAMKNSFDLFYQADRNLDRAEGGLGIGLSLVKSLVQMHGGTVEARSAGRGKGSEFIVCLPCLAATTPDQPAGSPAPLARPGHRLRALVVDDNHDSAESMALLLQLEGHEVLTAYDGKSAVEVSLRERPDLVLLDIGLPGLDGFQTCRAMRAGGLKDTLIVAMTGYGQAEDRQNSQQAGFDAHQVKPMDLQAIRDLLVQRTAQASSERSVTRGANRP